MSGWQYLSYAAFCRSAMYQRGVAFSVWQAIAAGSVRIFANYRLRQAFKERNDKPPCGIGCGQIRMQLSLTAARSIVSEG